jgi:hypothetical protein
MKIGHWPSGVSSEKARAGLKPMLREGFTTPDNAQKKGLFFNHVTRSEFRKIGYFDRLRKVLNNLPMLYAKPNTPAGFGFGCPKYLARILAAA